MAENNSSEDEGKIGVFNPKDPEKSTVPEENLHISIEASVARFTHRQDLLIEALEKFDPGFVKEMNDRAVVRGGGFFSSWLGGDFVSGLPPH